MNLIVTNNRCAAIYRIVFTVFNYYKRKKTAESINKYKKKMKTINHRSCSFVCNLQYTPYAVGHLNVPNDGKTCRRRTIFLTNGLLDFQCREFSWFSIYFIGRENFVYEFRHTLSLSLNGISRVAFELFEKKKGKLQREYIHNTQCFPILWNFQIEIRLMKCYMYICIGNHREPKQNEAKLRSKWNRKKTNLAQMKNDQIKANYIIL